ncbi:MAG: alanine racemase [Acidimicrobiales bacterium]
MNSVSAEGVHRPTWAEVSAYAIGHNVRSVKKVVGDSLICAVVKANGYGHGAPLVARAALDGGAHWLAVAIVDEGIELRRAGVSAPILLLAEADPSALGDAMANELTLCVASKEGALAVVREATTREDVTRVHLKVDTGMHRLGVAPEETNEVAQLLDSSSKLDLEGVFTHFSVANSERDEDREFTRHQIALFDEVLESLAADGVRPRVVHLANSAGALGYLDARRTMVRLGISLYGYLPGAWLADVLEANGVSLEPALTLRTKVSAVRRVRAHEAPSYGRRRPLASDATIVTAPFGYADGYPRRFFDAGAEVLINEKRYPLAGSVTMDQLVVDVGDDDVALGDEIVLLGRQGAEQIDADEWAKWGATISWEVLCALGARVARTLVN